MAIQYNSFYKTGTPLVHQPSDEPHGTYHLADNGNLFEIQRSNNFEIVITDLNNIQRAATLGGESSDTFSNGEEIIRLSVTRSSVPHFQQNAIEVKRGNNTVKYAGVPTFSSGTLVVNDYIGAETKEVLMAWQNCSYDVYTEKVGLVDDYKKECRLIEYSPDYQVVRTWVLYGCWISQLQEDDYDSDSNNKKTITATIEYDKASIETVDRT